MTVIRWCVAANIALFAGAATVRAGEIPLYQPAPAWVIGAPLPDPAKATADDSAILVFDHQQRIENGTLWTYADVATRATSADILSQLATLTLPWLPDKGDLIVHELQILRADQRIDLLASGKTFTVLRREESLEQRELTGILTATMALEGLQVGDILRLRYSTTVKDAALAGRVQSWAPILASPMRLGFGRVRIQWANASNARWKLLASGDQPVPVRKGAYTEITLPMPFPKQPEMPGDAPVRFRHPPLLEMSTFSNWSDVSKVMAPLYETTGLIGERGPLAGEMAKIAQAGGSTLDKTQRALRLVQDHVRYLAVGMNGGNYVPQTPQQTWAMRYGDCKAKTLLLLALLRGMNIEAEPVLASAQMGDLVAGRLPSAAAFDHVLVRAVVDGRTLWLDGTGSGARMEDIHDTPAFGNVLPLRTAGAELLTIVPHRNARPIVDMLIEADESTSVDLPSVFDATAVLRGQLATMFALAASQIDAEKRSEMVRGFLQGFTGPAQFGGISVASDPDTATTTLKARGIVTTDWKWDDKSMKRTVGRGLDDVSFAPDRSKPSWAAIPVATPDPQSVRYRLHLRLPDGGRGYTIDGEQNMQTKLAGYEFSRAMRIADGRVTIDERLDSTGIEIPVAQIPVERDRVARAKAQVPRLVAPVGALRYWDLDGRDPAGATQIRALETAFAKTINENPDEMTGYQSRASFRRGIGDRQGALADLDKAIEIAPDVALYLTRAKLRRDLDNLPGALADASAARALDPSDERANSAVAEYRAEGGDLAGALALLDERIGLGGDTRDTYRAIKASLVGTYGDSQEALKLADTLIAEKPGRPDLLNARCWIKGTRSVMLDTALKDCTSAIELSSSSRQALDSRALVWFRMGRYDDALRDLNAVLEDAPGLSESRFLRGIVLSRMNRTSEGAADLSAARKLSPRIDHDYARFGIKP